MKIVSKKVVKVDPGTPVYDVMSANPNNNFLLSNGIVAHNCGMMDELEFMKGQADSLAQSGVLSFYNNVKRRIQSRFLRNGKLPGTLFLISSKQDKNNFLEQYTNTVRDDPNTLIVDRPIWEIKPESTYSGPRFRVALGNKDVSSMIVPDNNEATDEEILEGGYDEILHVPIEYKSAFELDMNSALRDIAGKSTTAITKYMSVHAIRAGYNHEYVNPFTSEVISLGIDDNLAIQDFFRPERIPSDLLHHPCYIHIDTSLKGDRTGISMVAVDGVNNVMKYDQLSETRAIPATENHLRQVFTVGIQAPNGSEISLAKNREFIHYLMDLGYNVIQVTYDGFQSRDSLQLLTNSGVDAKYLSVDRTNDPYDTLRGSIMEKRISMIPNENGLLETELINLEKTVKGKIDHPKTGSKDLADSLAGASYSASKDTSLIISRSTEKLSELTAGSFDDERVDLDNLDISYSDITGEDINIVDNNDVFDWYD